MSEKDFEPQLTAKEIKLIKLFRIQSEERQQKIADSIGRLHGEHKMKNSENAENDKDKETAFWLNSEYYKK